MDDSEQPAGTDQEQPPPPADRAATIRPEPTDPEPPHGDPLHPSAPVPGAGRGADADHGD